MSRAAPTCSCWTTPRQSRRSLTACGPSAPPIARAWIPELEDAIGIDTNYVEAMETECLASPRHSKRPTMVLFTDGRHDVEGVPNRDVGRAHGRGCGDRSPIALLPVGMGLAAGDRDELTAGLEDLRVVRDMPPCVSGTTSNGRRWCSTRRMRPATPSRRRSGGDLHVHGGPNQAGHNTGTARGTRRPAGYPADARRRVHRRGLVARRPRERRPSPTTAPDAPATTGRSSLPRGCRRNPGHGSRGWSRAANTAAKWRRSPLPVRASGSRAGNCQPARDPASAGHIRASTAFNGAIDIGVEPATGVEEYRYECSSDGGTTWEESTAITSASTSARIRDLANGTEYVCRAFAANEIGLGDASRTVGCRPALQRPARLQPGPPCRSSLAP